MTKQVTISLTRLRFFAHHGFYAEERKIGNEFEVEISVSYIPEDDMITGLAATINYEQLYALVKNQMEIPRPLMETLAMEIAEAVHASFSRVSTLEISITKLNAPIIQFNGHAGVRYYREFK